LRGEGVAGGDNVGTVGEFGWVEGREQQQRFRGVPAGAEHGEEVRGAFGWAGGRRGRVGAGEDEEKAELLNFEFDGMQKLGEWDEFELGENLRMPGRRGLLALQVKL